MANKVLTSAFVRTIFKNGQSLEIKYATKTDNWIRIYLAPSTQDQLVGLVEKSSSIPENAAVVVMTEPEHSSPSDPSPHFTVVYQDKDGNHITSAHLS
ncbi:hypothetical protein GGR54DRAFT_642603 [Hypoxylon sp. NC1633]|nr:hypothetical protein GGR54DRAFT_642603 [Hypoxylon sp. NC1633]